MSTLLVSPYEGGNQEKRLSTEAFALALIISLSLLLSAVISLILFAKAGQALRALLPLFAGIMAVGSPFLVKRGKDLEGVGLAVFAMAITYVWFIFQIGGLGVLVSITFSLVLFSVTNELFPAAPAQQIRIGVVLAGVFLLLLDMFWPSTGRVETAGSLNLVLYLAISTSFLVPAYSMRRFSDYPFRKKLATVFLVLALFPLVVIVVLGQFFTRQALINDANQRLESAAIQTATSIDDFLISSLNSIRFQANNLGETGYLDLPELARPGSGAEARALAQLKIFRESDPLYISSYAILNTSGEKILEYPTGSADIDEMGQEYVTSSIESGLPYVSVIQFTPIPDGPFLFFSAPILNETSHVVGVLRARYRANILQQLVTRSSGLVGDQSFAVLYDNNYQILAHGTYQTALYKLAVPLAEARISDLQAQQLLDTQPVETLGLDNPDLADGLLDATEQPYFPARDISNPDVINQVAVTELGTKSWKVAYFQPRVAFLSPIQSQMRISILLAVVISAAIVALGMWLARLLSGPIDRLEATASRVSLGDLDARAMIEADDEIGSLAALLNQLTGRLQEHLLVPDSQVVNQTSAGAKRSEDGRKIFTNRNSKQVILEAVEEIQATFGYPHVQIYLMDEDGENLVLASRARVNGPAIRGLGDYIRVGQGRVGQAAQSNTIIQEPHRMQSVERESQQIPSERRPAIALPIAFGSQVLGVLSVQGEEVGGFEQGEVDALLSIADQVAFALRDTQAAAGVRSPAVKGHQELSQSEELVHQLASLNRLSQALSLASTLDDIFQATVIHLKGIIPLDQIGIALLKEEVGQYDIFALDEEKGALKIGTVVAGGTTLIDIALKQKRVVVAACSDLPGMQEFEAVMISPLTAGGRTFGTLNVGCRYLEGYQEHDQALFLQVATLVATTFEGRRLFLEARHLTKDLTTITRLAQLRASELAILNQLNRELSALSDVSSILKCVYQHTSRIMQVEKLTIALHDGIEPILDMHVFGDNGDGKRVMLQEKENSLIEYVLQRRQSLLLTDHVVQRMAELGFAPNGNVPKSWVGVPLASGKKEYGMIAVENYSQESVFREHELELLQAVAIQTSTAIEKTDLFKQEHASTRREQILREITTNVRGSADIDSSMRTAAQEVGRALGRQTFVYLSDGEEDAPTGLAEEPPHNEQ